MLPAPLSARLPSAREKRSRRSAPGRLSGPLPPPLPPATVKGGAAFAAPRFCRLPGSCLSSGRALWPPPSRCGRRREAAPSSAPYAEERGSAQRARLLPTGRGREKGAAPPPASQGSPCRLCPRPRLDGSPGGGQPGAETGGTARAARRPGGLRQLRGPRGRLRGAGLWRRPSPSRQGQLSAPRARRRRRRASPPGWEWAGRPSPPPLPPPPPPPPPPRCA